VVEREGWKGRSPFFDEVFSFFYFAAGEGGKEGKREREETERTRGRERGDEKDSSTVRRAWK